jgi:hypothetical protein
VADADPGQSHRRGNRLAALAITYGPAPGSTATGGCGSGAPRPLIFQVREELRQGKDPWWRRRRPARGRRLSPEEGQPAGAELSSLG